MRRNWRTPSIAAVAISTVMLVIGVRHVAARASTKMQEPKAGTQIQRLLKAFQGNWTITDRVSPDKQNPQGVTGTGSIMWRPGPGEYSVIEEFHSKQGQTDVTGLGIMWWDESANGYHTLWCDSTNPGGCIDFKNAAHWEGAELVLQEDYESNGKKFTFKEIFGDITANSFKQTLYGGEVGKDLKVDEVIDARRQ